MAKYTIEDVEILRQKSGISYEEAVSLLEYHNGSLARALMDLEKNGRLKTEPDSSEEHKGLKGIFSFLFRLRLLVKKEETIVVNLSSLFVLLVVIAASHIAIIGLIAALALGYHITIEKNSRAFADADFDEMVKNAKTNVQGTVNSFTQQFAKTESKQNETHEASSPHTDGAPSGTKPVSVQFPDGGSVNVRDEGDGYHEADIH